MPSLEEMCRELLRAAEGDGALEAIDNKEYSIEELPASLLLGMANLLRSHLRTMLMLDDREQLKDFVKDALAQMKSEPVVVASDSLGEILDGKERYDAWVKSRVEFQRRENILALEESAARIATATPCQCCNRTGFLSRPSEWWPNSAVVYCGCANGTAQRLIAEEKVRQDHLNKPGA